MMYNVLNHLYLVLLYQSVVDSPATLEHVQGVELAAVMTNRPYYHDIHDSGHCDLSLYL